MGKSNLAKALSALGYEKHQNELIQLYHLSGAFTDGRVPGREMNDDEITQFINSNQKYNSDEVFESDIQALKWFNQIGQEQSRRWRPTGVERQQMKKDEELSNHKSIISKLFEKLGFFNELLPKKPEVQALLILGASETRARMRIAYAEDLIINEKVRPTQIILGTGARDLWPKDSNNETKGDDSTMDFLIKLIKEKNNDIDEKTLKNDLQRIIDKEFDEVLRTGNMDNLNKKRSNIVQRISREYDIIWPTEADMMRKIVENNTTIRQNFNHIDIVTVNAPKLPTGERPNTQSVINCLISTVGEQLKGMDVAVISSQPHAKYQEGSIKNAVGELFNMIMVAPGISNEEKSNLTITFEALFGSIFSWVPHAENLLSKEKKESVQDNIASHLTDVKEVTSGVSVKGGCHHS